MQLVQRQFFGTLFLYHLNRATAIEDLASNICNAPFIMKERKFYKELN